MKNYLLDTVKRVTANKKAMMLVKVLSVAFIAGVVAIAYADPAFASDMQTVADPIIKLINKFINPLLGLVGAGGVLFCIVLGVKYATAEEPQEREKRKQALKTAIIGYILIFVLIVALKLSIGPLSQWVTESISGKTSAPSIPTDGK